MSVGGVNPLEWIFPPLALSHVVVDTASKAITGKEAAIMPGSPVAKAENAQEEQQREMEAAQKLSQSREEERPKPLTGDDELQSRRRAISASDFITGKRRASQGLAEAGAL